MIAAIPTDSPYLIAAIYLIATLVVAKIVDILFDRHSGRLARLFRRELTVAEKTRLSMARRVSVFTIVFFGVAAALVQLPNVGTLARGMLASATITAMIAGFAARSVLANLVSGVVIAFAQPVRIGDYVSVDGIEGVVEEIGLSYSFIRADDNRRVVIPNELFASKMIHNFTILEEESSADVDLVVPASVDLTVLEALLREEAARLSGGAKAEVADTAVDVRDETAADATSDAASGVAADAAVDAEDGRPTLRRPATFAVIENSLDSTKIRVTLWAASAPEARALAADLHRAALERLRREGLLTART